MEHIYAIDHDPIKHLTRKFRSTVQQHQKQKFSKFLFHPNLCWYESTKMHLAHRPIFSSWKQRQHRNRNTNSSQMKNRVPCALTTLFCTYKSCRIFYIMLKVVMIILYIFSWMSGLWLYVSLYMCTLCIIYLAMRIY